MYLQVEHKETPFYHVKLKNVFSEVELKEVIQKIFSLGNNFKLPEDTCSAMDGKEFLKKNTGIFLDELDENRNIILEKIDNVLKIINKKSEWKNLCFKRIFSELKWGGDLVQKYKNKDYYKPHFDNGIFTMVIWIYDGKNNINGGDLYFPEYDYLYPCENNSGIVFFSKELHGVTALSSANNYSRYSITTFSSHNTQDLNEENLKYRTLLKNKLNSNFNYN